MGMSRMIKPDNSKLEFNMIMGYIGLIFTTLMFPIGLFITLLGLGVYLDKERWLKGLPLNLFNLALGIFITLIALRIIAI